MMDRKAEYAEKRRRVLAYLEAHELSAAVLTSRAGFSWYTAGGSSYVSAGGELGTVSIVVTPERDVAVADNIEAPRQQAEEIGALGMQIEVVPWHDAEARAAAIRRAAGDRPAADAPCGIEASPLGEEFAALRLELTEWEIERFRRLGRGVAAAMEAACRTLRPGATECMFAADAAGCLRGLGLLPWVVLVATDERIEQYRHPLPTIKEVRERAMLVVCAECGGLICSATRLVSFSPLPEALAARHRACVQVDARMIQATRPGATLGDVFRVAQEAYAAGGFDGEWRHHHQGGPTGYLPRERIAVPNDPMEVLANQAFAWNPSIRGTKSEDTLLVGAEGNEILSAADRWPMLEVEVDGTTWQRPDILVVGT
jgi:Xaa-Pro aminopeptidase